MRRVFDDRRNILNKLLSLLSNLSLIADFSTNYYGDGTKNASSRNSFTREYFAIFCPWTEAYPRSVKKKTQMSRTGDF